MSGYLGHLAFGTGHTAQEGTPDASMARYGNYRTYLRVSQRLLELDATGNHALVAFAVRV